MVAAMQAGNLELEKYVSGRVSVETRADIDSSSVRHLVLDEADRMLDTEFLEQVQEVVAACTHPDVQKAVFSATLPANAEKIALGMLRNPIRVVVGLKYVLALRVCLVHPLIYPKQGYTPSAHRTVADVRRGRRVQVTDAPAASVAAI